MAFSMKTASVRPAAAARAVRISPYPSLHVAASVREACAPYA